MAQPVQFQVQESITIEDDEIPRADSDSDTEIATPNYYWQSEIFKNYNQLMLHRVEKGSSEYVNVARSFVNGMRNYEGCVEVVGIHRKNYRWSVIDEARVESFRGFASAFAIKNGGDPNIKYGWVGSYRQQIGDILCHGFRRFGNNPGVFFSPENYSIASYNNLLVDSNGVMHILLCRLILGKQEPIPFGSKINKPSSKEFDSGVDNISSPKRYIIWEPYMNTLVLPVFVVSFTADKLKRVNCDRRHAMFKILITNLPKYVSPSKMAFIKKQHDQFYQKKISGETFKRNLKIIVGVDVLKEIIRVHNESVKGHIP